MIDEKAVELREIPKKTVPAHDLRHLAGKKEAMLHAWRPAGSASLAERWLSAGEQPKQKVPRKERDLWKAARALSRD